MDEVRELRWVSQKEYWSVICDMIPVALLSSELDGEAPGVSSAVVRTRFATNGRKSDCYRTLLSLGREQVCDCQIIERVCAGENTVSTAALCVNDTLWDTLAIEVG